MGRFWLFQISIDEKEDVFDFERGKKGKTNCSAIKHDVPGFSTT
jgi:hypothetical protein